jgi:hypothetical protein
MDESFFLLALYFFLSGITLLSLSLCGLVTLRCKKCPCTCVYGFLLVVLAILIKLIVGLLIFAQSISDETVIAYCEEDWENIPFGLGPKIKDSFIGPVQVDALLNAP